MRFQLTKSWAWFFVASVLLALLFGSVARADSRSSSVSATWTYVGPTTGSMSASVSAVFNCVYSTTNARWDITGTGVTTSNTGTANATFSYSLSANGTTQSAGGSVTNGGTAGVANIPLSSLANGASTTYYCTVIADANNSHYSGGGDNPVWLTKTQAFANVVAFTVTKNANGTPGAISIAGGVAPKFVAVDFVNDNPYPVQVKLKDQNGNDIPGYEGTVTVPAYSSMPTQTVQLPEGVTGVSLLTQIPNMQQSDGAWYVVEGAVTDMPLSEVIPGVEGTPTPTSVSGPAGMPSSGPNPLYQSPLEARYGPGAWTTSSPTTGGDALDKKTYIEGVNKVETAIRSSAGVGAGEVGTGGGGTDMSGVINKLEQQRQDAGGSAAGEAVEETKASFADPAAKGAEGVALATGWAEQGKLETQAAMSTLFGAGPSGVGGVSGAVDNGNITVKASKHVTLTIPKNPFSANGPFSGAMAKLATFVRRLIAWGAVVAFFVWALGKIRAMVAEPFKTTPFGTSVQDSINSIKAAGFGGGTGYLAKMAILLVLLPVMLTLPVGVMAAIEAGLPWADLKEIYSLGPDAGTGNSMFEGALALANVVLPWTLLLSLPLYYFLIEFILFPSQFFWQMFMKMLPT